MDWLISFLPLIHLIGLVLGVGAATVKLVLLFRCTADYTFVPAYLKVVGPITRLILIGLLLLTLSGLAWLLFGYPFSFLLGVKLVLVIGIWVIGPIIDKVAEPKVKKLAPAPGDTASPEFVRALKQYLTLEVLADLLFYGIIIIWVLR